MKNNLLILAFILAATAFFIFISCKEDKEPQQKKTLFEDPSQILGKWYRVNSESGNWARLDFKETWFNLIKSASYGTGTEIELDSYSYYRIISDSIIEFRHDHWKCRRDWGISYDTSYYSIWHSKYTYINDTLTIFWLLPVPTPPWQPWYDNSSFIQKISPMSFHRIPWESGDNFDVDSTGNWTYHPKEDK